MIKSFLEAMKMCIRNMDKTKKSECDVEEINHHEDVLTDTCSLKKGKAADSRDSHDSQDPDNPKKVKNCGKLSLNLKIVKSQESQRSCYYKDLEKKEIFVSERNEKFPQIYKTSHRSNFSKKEKIDTNSQEVLLQRVNTFAHENEDIQEKFSGVLSPKFQENELEQYSKKNTTLLSDQRTTAENLNFINFPPSSLQTDPESLRQQFFKSEMEKIEKMSRTTSIKVNSKESHRGLLFTNENLSEEVPDKVFCMNNIVILDSEISQAKKLVVEDEEGDFLSNHYLVIDASGLLNGLRKKRDGYVFFGTKAEYKKTIINDFVVNYNQDVCKSRLFVIFYQRCDQKYYIRNINDSESNVLMYIKMTNPYPIRRKQYFSINQIAFSVDPQDEHNSQDKLLKIVVYDQAVEKEKDKTEKNGRESLIPENGLGSTKSTSTSKVFNFKPEDSPITIGRLKCSISLDFSFLSKRHCVIEYNKNEGVWEICDGYKGKPSTNGTWLLLKSKYEISNTTYFKIGSNIIKVGLLN